MPEEYLPERELEKMRKIINKLFLKAEEEAWKKESDHDFHFGSGHKRKVKKRNPKAIKEIIVFGGMPEERETMEFLGEL